MTTCELWKGGMKKKAEKGRPTPITTSELRNDRAEKDTQRYF